MQNIQKNEAKRTSQTKVVSNGDHTPDTCQTGGLLADELEIVDVDVVVGAGDVHLELDPVDLGRRDLPLEGISPTDQLLHLLEGEHVLLPLVGEDHVGAEVV